ncbi:similar to Saccharomyces cerevisiae YMR239C RNT1 RNAase III [Maudiozyma saulgeensis]|uniref:ribonuclease III n=1 Tax=Maudiozyma saulgeensis TaxID=1789683 RepID=A0A1X7R9D3_9SACH|nr:similar to Saccharomyces cerevisiae YMR239C RNT1 RNAase III [Kazachstania saulgeensis]
MGSSKKEKSKRKHSEIGSPEVDDQSVNQHKRRSSKKDDSSKHKNKKHTSSKKEKKEKKHKKSKKLDADDKKIEIPFSNFYNYSQALELEHAVTKFVESYNKIIELSPNFKTYQQIDKNKDKIDFQLVPSFSRYKLKFAAELKSLNELHKQLNFQDLETYEARFNNNETKPVLENLTTNDIKELEQSKPLAVTNGNELINSNEIFGENKEHTEDIPTSSGKDWPPELLPIKNIALKSQVFIHKSMVNNKLYLTEKEMLHTHNERLEFLGDSVLNTLMTLIIYKMFPNYDEGQLSSLRIQLINNQKLKEFSQAYDMDRYLKSNVLQDGGAKYFAGKQKMTADIFEAYVGALVEDKSVTLDDIQTWLEKLAMPTIKECTSTKKGMFEDNNDLNINAKRKLYSLIGYAALELQYQTVQRPTRENPETTVVCKIGDGTILGSGTARNTKLAGLRAAEDVLSKKDVIEKYANQRAAIPRSESSTKASNTTSKFSRVNNHSDENGQNKSRNTHLPISSTTGKVVLGPDGELQMQ